MWSEEEVRNALVPWRAIADGMANDMETFDDPYQRGLAEGYASALEMVLREN